MRSFLFENKEKEKNETTSSVWFPIEMRIKVVVEWFNEMSYTDKVVRTPVNADMM